MGWEGGLNNTKSLPGFTRALLLLVLLAPFYFIIRSLCIRAFTGAYWDHHAKGLYTCVVCKQDLFDSDTKFDSGSGWPSFYDVLEKGKVKLVEDNTAYMNRTEVLCAQVG